MNKTFKYNFLLAKKYQHHPFPKGYYWTTIPLPDYQHIEITYTETGKYVKFYSKLHVNKLESIGPSYSLEFTDHEIIKDLSGKIAYRYGIDL